jgi:cytochrome c
MDLGFNKIAFCVLATGLVAIGLNELSKGFFVKPEPKAHGAEGEEHAKVMGYRIEVPEHGSAGPVTAEVEGPVDFFTLISAADVEAGKGVAAKCLQCHHFEPNAGALQGPNLYDVMGRDIASLAGFKYSEGDGSLSAVEGVWDYDHLYRFLEAPKRYAPNTAMNFVGVRKQSDRINLIAYLRTLHDGDLYPLPEPLPPAPVDAAAPADPNAPPVEGAAPADPNAPSPVEGATPSGAAPAAPAAPAVPAPAH